MTDISTGREYFGEGSTYAAEMDQLQKMCCKSEIWDEALLVQKTNGAQQHTRAKLSALLADVVDTSYTDYISSALGSPAQDEPAKRTTRTEGHATVWSTTKPIAIPARTKCHDPELGDEFLPLDPGHSEYVCSADDLYAARNKWLPRTTPPDVDSDRYAWAVDLLEHTMAMAETIRDDCRGQVCVEKHVSNPAVSQIERVDSNTNEPRLGANAMNLKLSTVHPLQSKSKHATAESKRNSLLMSMNQSAASEDDMYIGRADEYLHKSILVSFSCPLDGWQGSSEDRLSMSFPSPQGPDSVVP